MYSRWMTLFCGVAFAPVEACPVVDAAAALTGDPVDWVNPLSGANGDAESSRGNTLEFVMGPEPNQPWRAGPVNVPPNPLP